MALFIGRLAREVTRRDLEDIFYTYGKILRCEVKYGGYGFVEFEDRHDAERAIKREDGARLYGQRIVVEWAKGEARKNASDSDECFYCKKRGHWARDCPDKRSEADRHRRRRSRSPVRRERDAHYREEKSRSRSRGRSSSRSPSRSRTPSRSPSKRDETKEERRRSDSRTPSHSSPSRSRSPSPSPSRSRSPLEN